MKSYYPIKEKILDIFTEIKKFNRPLKLNPLNAALLVLDMQDFFLKEISHAFVPSVSQIIPVINELIVLFRQLSRPVILTRHLNTPSDAKLMSRWWKDLIKREDPLSTISDKIVLFSKAIVIEKTQYDAFYKTELEKILLERKVKQLVICGVMTHLCCETTARSAFVRGFEVYFPADATATYNENFHRASLLNLAHGFAVITTAEDIAEILRSNLREGENG